MTPRIKFEDSKNVKDKQTLDSYSNFNAKLGLGADNLMSNSTYSLNNMVSRNHTFLEASYRSSWLVGIGVDAIAEDMTKNGVEFFSEMSPDDIQELQSSISKFAIWEQLCDTIKWARLYGGAIAVMLIDGAKYDKPLNIESIGKDKFQGLLVLDRWMIQPSFESLIKEMSKDLGMPEYYSIIPAATGIPLLKVHHSRVLRFDGIKLPYYQKLSENLWGLSVVERMLDRLVAYDSATMGAAQLLYKAYLRVIQVEGFREALAIGGKEEAAVLKQFKYMRQMQSNEGITLLDSKDTFAVHQYAFSGISDLLIQFGEQIAGAWEMPLVRLFGQSPTGLSSTGASDIRNYYDGINKKQENQLRPKLNVLFDIMCRSELGKELPKDFEFKFIPLWQMNDKEKSEIAVADAATVTGVYGAGIINKKISLQELKQQSRSSGRFTNIVEENIKAAEKEDNARPPEGVEPVEEELSDEELLDIAESTEFEETTDEWSEEARKKAIETRKRNANLEENKTNAEVPKKKLSDLNDSEKKRLTDILLKKIKQAKQKLENKEVKENVQKKLNEMIENLSSKVKHLNVNEKIEEMLKVDSIDVDSEEMKTVEMKKNDIGNKVSFKDKMVKIKNILLDSDFKESEHPREKGGSEAGQFAAKGSGGESSFKSKEKEESKKKSKEKKILTREDIEIKIKNAESLEGEDLRGLDLKGLNFSRMNLSGTNLSYTDLSNTNLSNTNLSNVNFSSTNLSFADLSNANLSDTDLSNANLNYVNLDGVIYNNKKLSKEFLSILRTVSELEHKIFLSNKVKNKKFVEKVLSDKLKISEEKGEIEQKISQWAKTSGDNDKISIGYQLIARNLFDLKEAVIDHWKQSLQNKALPISKDKNNIAFIKAQYNETQEWFKKEGYKPTDEILLFRGVKGERGGTKSQATLQPLSSFSTSYKVATRFGSHILVSKVLVSQIFSHPLSGFGCTEEHEMVVLGGKVDITEINNILDASKLYDKETSQDSISDNFDIENLDVDLENADWTKTTWDLPEFGSDKFNVWLEKSGTTLEHFKTLPVYKNKDKGTVKSKNIENNKDESYTGNMGIMELFDFYKKANPEQTAIMEKIIKASDWFAFKQLIKKVLGIALKDTADSDLSLEAFKNAIKKDIEEGSMKPASASHYLQALMRQGYSKQDAIKMYSLYRGKIIDRIPESKIINDYLNSKDSEKIFIRK